MSRLFLQRRLPIRNHYQGSKYPLVRLNLEQEALPVRADVPIPAGRFGKGDRPDCEKRLRDALGKSIVCTPLVQGELLEADWAISVRK